MSTIIFGQQKIIKGFVYDVKGEPIENVKVAQKNTENYVFTDSSGYYELIYQNGNNTLIFSKEGYNVSNVEIKGNDSAINITLAAEGSVDIFDLTLEDLMNISVSSVSKKLESANEAPQTVIVLTAEELMQRGYTDLEQVFHDLPGFDITRGTGTEYSQIYQRGYRSNNTNRTLILVDGVEQNDLWSNSAWISLQHSLSNIKQIEIIYGPSSTMYGANAFLGVVNIVTKNSEDIISSKDAKLGINSQLGYGSWNSKFFDVSLATKGKNISWVMTGRYYYSDMPDFSKYKDWNYDLKDFDLDYYKNILGTTSDSLARLAMQLDSNAYYYDSELNGIEPHFSNTKKDWYIYSKLQINKFTLGIESYKLVEGYGGWYTDKYELGPENGGSWGPFNTSIYAKYETEISKKLNFSAFSNFKVHRLVGATNEEYYYIGYMNGGYGIDNLLQKTDTTISYNNETNSLDTSYSSMSQTPYWWHANNAVYSEQFRTEARLSYKASDKFNIISGVEYRQSFLQGSYMISYDEKTEETAAAVITPGGNQYFVSDFGLYSQAAYSPIKNLKFVLGGRADYNRIRLEGGYGLVFNPKVAIVFSPKRFVIKAIYSEAMKDAGMWDKYGTTPGRLLNNPTLPPEKVRNVELGSNIQVSKNILFDVAGFYSMYTNIIGTVDVTFVDDNGETVNTTQHQAVGRLLIKGAMGTLKYISRNFSAYYNFTLTNPQSINEDGTFTRVGDIATFNCNLGANVFFLKKFNLNMRLNYVGLRPTGANTTISSNPVSQVNPYYLVNATFSYVPVKFLTLQIIGNNLLNSEYFYPGVRSANGDYYASVIPGYERSIFGKIIINF